MQIINMMEKGRQLGGLPSRLDISVEEATQIINEINTLRSESDSQHNRYKFTNNEADARLAFTGRELSDSEKFNLLTEWTKGNVAVSFDGVPVQVLVEIPAKEQQHYIMG